MAQDRFAEALDVSRTTVSNIERGAQRIFLDQVYRAAEILDVPVTTLLPPQEIFHRVIVQAAADDPLPAAAGKRMAQVVQEMTVKYRPAEGD